MRNRWLALAFCAAVVLIACANVPHPPGLTVTPEAMAVADSVYALATNSNAETGLCVASGGYAWGWAQDGRLWVHVRRFALGGRQAAQIRDADSMHVWWRSSICGDSLPSWHTHLAMSMPGPSNCDKLALAVRPRVPFALVQFGPGQMLVYNIEPGMHYVLAHDPNYYCDPRR